MADIKRILNKKGWTGRELGIIEVTNMARVYQQMLNGEPVTELVPKAEFHRMINGITDVNQGRIYNGYISIHEWITTVYNISQTHFQQAQLSFRTIHSFIQQAMLAEEVLSYIDKLPKIMTPKQYEERKAYLLEESFKDTSGEELFLTVYDLFVTAFNYYLDQLHDTPGAKNPLKAIRNLYTQRPIKSRIAWDGYKYSTGNGGYYELPDGRRSDEMSREEWQAAITTPKMRELLDEIEAETEEGKKLREDISYRRYVERAKILFNGGSEEDADKHQQQRDKEEGLATFAVWHYYEEPPEDVTLWDFVDEGLFMDSYPGLPYIHGKPTQEELEKFTAAMEDLKAEFPELVDAILAEIDKKYSSAMGLELSSVPVKEWATTGITERKTYEINFYGEREQKNSVNDVFFNSSEPEDEKAAFVGIAILQTDREGTVDERGYYAEPEIHRSLSHSSLEAFFPESEDYADNVEMIEQARENLLTSYYYLMGYNLALDLVAEHFDVPDIVVFKAALDSIRTKVKALNDLVPCLYDHIRDGHYRDADLTERKMEVLQDIFPEIDIDTLEIPQENIEKAKQLFKDFQAFSGDGELRFSELIFTYQPPEEVNEGGLTE